LMKRTAAIVLIVLVIAIAMLGAVMWHNSVFAQQGVAVMWHNSAVQAPVSVAVMWHNSAPVSVAVMWHAAAYVDLA
jgi:hypothetical protein